MNKHTLAKQVDHSTQDERNTRQNVKRKNLDDSTQKVADQENKKSAITEHCTRNNHIMDWDMERIVTLEANKYKQWVKGTIKIRKWASNSLNQDEGAYTLLHTWDFILQRPPAEVVVDLTDWPRDKKDVITHWMTL